MTRTYLVECYWPGVTADDIAGAEARVAAIRPRDAASGLRWIDAVLVPDDEIVLCLFESDSADAVAAAARQAGLPFERVVEAARISERRLDERFQGRSTT